MDLFGFNSLGHAVYTGAFGAGLGLATWTRSRKATLGFPLLGLGAGMLMHAVHNGLVSVVLAGRYGITVAANFLTVDASGEQLVATYNAADAVRKVTDSVFVGMFFVAIALWLWYQRRLIRDALAEEARRGLVSSEELEALPRYWQRVGWYWRLLLQRRFAEWRTTRRIHNELIDLAFLKRRVAQGTEDSGRIDELRERIAVRQTRVAVA